VTAEASEARLTRARRRGDVPVSRRLLRAVGLAAALVALPVCARRLWDAIAALLRTTIMSAAERNVDTGPSLGRGAVMRVIGPLFDCLLPLVIALALGAIIAALLQGGGRWTTERAARRNGESWWSSLLSVALFLVTALVGVRQLATALPSLLGSPDTGDLTSRRAALASLERTLSAGYDQASFLLWALTAVALAAGVLDAVLERVAWRKRHALPPGEERRERRSQEISPEVRSARQRAHRTVAQPRPERDRATS
jgi:flagellar biosynthesis protein FlhB